MGIIPDGGGMLYCACMKTVLVISVLVLLGLSAFGFGRWRHARTVARIEGALAAAPVPVMRSDLPPEVAAYAHRALNGQPPARLLHFEQTAKMELRTGAGWRNLTARQTIAATAAGFIWNARQGPVSVIDSLADGRGLLEVRLLRSFRLARAAGPDIDRAEAMRYLAELPWCPDAILVNAALQWRVLAPDRWQVTLGGAEVTFTLEQGDITRMNAKDRPALEAGQTVLRDWVGVFTDYKVIGGRRIPVQGEVGYMIDGAFAPYFIGRMTGLVAAD